MGAEVASPGELAIALKAGFPAKMIVLDSPAKTMRELTLALEKGLHLNVDNLQELERVNTLVASGKYRDVSVGLRVNPQIGAGSLLDLSTATLSSKFGFGLRDIGDGIVDLFRQHAFLTRLHCHVGSQGCPLSLIATGVRATVDCALRVNGAMGRRQITSIDIGGGLPVNFGSEDASPTISEYAAVLKAEVPELFDGTFSVITELGRAVIAKAGFILSRVEYTKTQGGRRIALEHAGADLMVRTVYHPDKWPLRISVFSAQGTFKNPDVSELFEQDVAGPCCFAGDVIAHQRPLPLIEQGDYVLVHDVGGYYHSQFSRYNVRLAPAMYACDTDIETKAESVPISLIKRGETLEDAMRFFE
eukprot:TRINITY_DN1387_c0_g1_i3.p1 TRINITY_DN1387_c0_g1~~TRINITY_DN1387_c0_g1_i3.p1  ORF type:complete len:360 (+),score=69.96 TRINITY_DN1387_c0_g1_i3:283-1362(+)